MPMTAIHKEMIRDHFKMLLGGKCIECQTVLNLEFHHINASGCGEGRGSEKRIWELFMAYHRKANITLLCHECHVAHHKKEGENER